MFRKKNQSKGLSPAELSTFCGQVALVLEAGLPLYDGMETLAGADAASGSADIYRAASKTVTETGSLYEALKSDPRWPEYLREMVGIGERSGQLEKVMRGLETYYAREDRIRSSVMSAVTYPMVLGILLVVIVLILLWAVLPVFRRVIDAIGGMSEAGRTMMSIGTAVGWVVLALVGLVVLGAVAGLILLRTRHRDKVLGLAQRLIPSLSRLNRRLSASRVAGVLSMMLSGGFPTDEALDMTAAVLSDKAAAEKVRGIRSALDAGKPLAEAISDTDLFDELHDRMITMGVATGREDQVLGKLAELYEDQAEEDITRLISVIEPSLVALLSIVIGAVLLSVMLPMAGILSSL